jgi:hypothetical protein
MLINKVVPITFKENNSTKHKPNFVKITGYSCLGLGLGSIISGKTNHLKLHKYLAYTAGILALAHTGLIEYYHHKFKK